MAVNYNCEFVTYFSCRGSDSTERRRFVQFWYDWYHGMGHHGTGPMGIIRLIPQLPQSRPQSSPQTLRT